MPSHKMNIQQAFNDLYHKFNELKHWVADRDAKVDERLKLPMSQRYEVETLQRDVRILEQEVRRLRLRVQAQDARQQPASEPNKKEIKQSKRERHKLLAEMTYEQQEDLHAVIRAQVLRDAGRTHKEIANQLGVPASRVPQMLARSDRLDKIGWREPPYLPVRVLNVLEDMGLDADKRPEEIIERGFRNLMREPNMGKKSTRILAAYLERKGYSIDEDDIP